MHQISFIPFSAISAAKRKIRLDLTVNEVKRAEGSNRKPQLDSLIELIQQQTVTGKLQ